MNYFLFQVKMIDNTIINYAVASETATAARQADSAPWNDAKQYGEPKFINGQKVSRTKYMNSLATHKKIGGAA